MGVTAAIHILYLYHHIIIFTILNIHEDIVWLCLNSVQTKRDRWRNEFPTFYIFFG